MIKIVNPVYWKIKRKILTWLHPNLTIGYGTMVIGWPKITGSGRIYIGKNCRLIKPKLKCHGVLRIGDNCFLNYTSIVTKLNIDIDDWTIISDAYIVDTDFHNIHPLERHKPLSPKATRAIKIEKNVWIGDNCTILKGSIIKSGTVIGSNSVVRGEVPENCVAIGNPIQVIKQFKNL